VSFPTAVPRQDSPPPRGRQAWVERLARFKESGQSPAAFCARERVSLPSFYSWRRRLEGPRPELAAEAAPRLLPVLLQGQVCAPVEAVLPSGVVLRLPSGCDLALVRSLVDLLGGKPC
jgi:hypothetical protein